MTRKELLKKIIAIVVAIPFISCFKREAKAITYTGVRQYKPVRYTIDEYSRRVFPPLVNCPECGTPFPHDVVMLDGRHMCFVCWHNSGYTWLDDGMRFPKQGVASGFGEPSGDEDYDMIVKKWCVKNPKRPL